MTGHDSSSDNRGDCDCRGDPCRHIYRAPHLNETAHRLQDPRWHWMLAALGNLYDQLEAGQNMTGLVLGVVDAEGVLMHYTATPGEAVKRHIITKAAQKFAGEFAREAIDVTMTDAPI